MFCSYSAGIDFRRQDLTSNLTFKVDPRAVEVNPILTEASQIYLNGQADIGESTPTVQCVATLDKLKIVMTFMCFIGPSRWL